MKLKTYFSALSLLLCTPLSASFVPPPEEPCESCQPWKTHAIHEGHVYLEVCQDGVITDEVVSLHFAIIRLDNNLEEDRSKKFRVAAKVDAVFIGFDNEGQLYAYPQSFTNRRRFRGRIIDLDGDQEHFRCTLVINEDRHIRLVARRVGNGYYDVSAGGAIWCEDCHSNINITWSTIWNRPELYRIPLSDQAIGIRENNLGPLIPRQTGSMGKN